MTLEKYYTDKAHKLYIAYLEGKPNWTQEMIAKSLGISRSQVSKYKTGLEKIPAWLVSFLYSAQTLDTKDSL